MFKIKKRVGFLAAAILFSLWISAPVLLAQSQYISGTVTDASGAVIAGAKISITDVSKNTIARETTSDDQGRFMALNVQPGAYLVAVEMSGFKKVQRTIQLEVNTKLDIGQVQMQIGEISESVMVTEALPTVQTNTMEKAFLVDNKQIQELPMNGRNWVSLMNTVPGVNSGARSDFDINFNDVSSFHANGGRGSQNNFYLDGSPNLDVGDNQSQYTQPSIDSIAEFKVQQSSFNAEYGRNSGMVVAVQTKSGSANFHGTLYEYLRNDAFDAMATGFSDAYNTAKTSNPNAKKIKDKLRYNQFGGNFSGWIPFPKVSSKDQKKLFFFYNREMTRRSIAASGSKYSDIPAPDILINGNFSAWLTDKNMDYAPQFKVGTIFQPGTIKRDGAGNITGGVAFANNTVPTSMWNARSSALLKLYTGVANYKSLPVASPGYVRYTFTAPSNLRKDQDLLRLDYIINNRFTSYFRWVNDYQKEENYLGVWVTHPFIVNPMNRPKPGSSWSYNLVGSLTPSVATETILSYNHQSQSLGSIDTSLSDRDKLGASWTQLYPAANIANLVANLTASPLSTLNFGNVGWHNDGRDYSLTENVSWMMKKHTMKFGFHYNRDNKKQTAGGNGQGSINFNGGASVPLDTNSGLANLMLGNFSTYTQPNVHVYPYFRFQSWEGFAQDSWKMTPRLTLEYGIRFQRSTPTYTYLRDGAKPPVEGGFPVWSVDPARYNSSTAPQIEINRSSANYAKIIGDAQTQLMAVGLVCDPCNGVKRGFADSKNMWAPRLGFAYDLFGDGKTALRAGFGVFYERLRQNNFNFSAGNAFPNITSATQVNGNVNNIDLSVTAAKAAVTPPAYVVFIPDNTMPVIYSWNLGVQKELQSKFTLDLSYVGNRGTHLMIQRYFNSLPAGTYIKYPTLLASVNSVADALRPFRGFGRLTGIETTGYSSYHAFLTRLSRRFANRFSFNVNYTWSKTMDLVDNDSDTINNPFNIRMNWAPAGYDMTHFLAIDYIYDLPKAFSNRVLATMFNDWQFSGIAKFATGRPIDVTSNGNMQCIDCNTTIRPNVVGDPMSGSNQWRYFNAAAFTRPVDGDYGSLGRNTLRMPGINNFDLSLAKRFRFTEGINFMFRLEAYNAFNHPQIWGINTSFTADNQGGGLSSTNRTFGTPTSWRDNRVLQMGFKLTF